MVQKIYSKTHPLSCTDTHHDVTDLINHGMVKDTKNLNSLRTEHNFSTNKKILTRASDDTFWEVL